MPAAKDCLALKGCECLNDPIRNFSSENTDEIVFFAIPFWSIYPRLCLQFPPDVNRVGPVIRKTLPVDAEEKKKEEETSGTHDPNACANPPCDTPVVDVTFYNDAQTVSGTCPDGTTDSFTVVAGAIAAMSKAEANALAHSIAVEQLRLRLICLSELPDSWCLETSFDKQIIANGGSVAQTNLWQIISGDLPPGLTARTGNVSGPLVIQGTPVVEGFYTFVVQITTPDGVSKAKTYSMSIIGITSAKRLLDATPNEPYYEILNSVGFSGPVEWQVIIGRLPEGLSLNASSGEIFGTPIQIGDFALTISLSDATRTCTKDFDLSVFSYSYKRINAWKEWTGWQTLLNEFSGTGCIFPTDPPCVDVPPGNCDCPKLPPALVCDTRWLVRSERSVWNNSYYHDSPGNDSTNEMINGVRAEVDDAYVYSMARYSSGNIIRTDLETHHGLWTGDPYDVANSLSEILTNDPDKPFIWSVEALSTTRFKVNISFWTVTSGANFVGWKEIQLSSEYTLKMLQDDLIRLWDAVNPDDYPWVTGGFDIDVTYDTLAHNSRKVQYCDFYPNLEPPSPAVYDPLASSQCRTTGESGQPLTSWSETCPSCAPPLTCGLPVITPPSEYNYFGGWLFAGKPVVPSDFACVNLTKAIVRFRGSYCVSEFSKALPIQPEIGGLCDPCYGPEIITPKISTSLTPIIFLPLPGDDPYEFSPGFQRMLLYCRLGEWWTMEEQGLDPRLGSLHGAITEMVPIVNGAGSIQAAPGRVNLGVEFKSTTLLESQLLQGSLVPELAFGGPYTNGITITGWFKFTESFDASADNLGVRVIYDTGSNFGIVVQGGQITAQVDIFGVGATAIFVPFTPVIGNWYFFRAFFDSINQVVGVQIDNGTVHTQAGTGEMPITTTGRMFSSFTSLTAFQQSKLILDELNLFLENISNAEASFLFNGGAGRTFGE